MILPQLSGLRLRYCSRSDEQPAGILAKSMLRLGISRLQDWTGSAVDFVAKGLARYGEAHGIKTVSRIFSESCIRLMDEIVELAEYQRIQSEKVGPSSQMFLSVDYEQAAMIQIGPALEYLGGFHPKLPAGFFMALATNLGRWMHVYDYRDAQFYAQEQIHMLDEKELQESFYPKVESVPPRWLKRLPSYSSAVRLLRAVLPKLADPPAQGLLRHCLAMHEEGADHELAAPYRLVEKMPEIEDYLENTDHSGPGSLIVFEEDDLVEACFNEEMQYLGQDYAIASTILLPINLNQRSGPLDTQVRSVFDYLGAMLRSLASASALIEMIRGIYDENLRQRGLQPGLQAQKSTAGLRRE